MGSAIALREDFDGAGLRRLAKATKDAGQGRRLLALAEVYDGGACSDAARIGGVGLQVIRDWVLRYNADGPKGLIDRKAPGQAAKLNAAQRRALAAIVESGPIPAIHGVLRWRLKDLAHWIFEEFRISLDETTVGRELKSLGFCTVSARRCQYAQNELAIEDFKKAPGRAGGGPRRAPAWHRHRTLVAGRSADRSEKQDHPAMGAPGKPTKGTARSTHDQRTKSAYIFGAICPQRGVGAALVLPRCNTQAMQWHLDEISSRVTPGAHAVLILDQAGWHTSDKLAIPTNITLLPLPPRAPELNPVENI